MSKVKKEELEKIYEEAKEPREAGEQVTGEIVEIKWGKAKEFFNNPAGDPEDQMIQFIVNTPDNYPIRITGKLSMHPMSKFRRLTDILGHKPKYGDKVPLVFDGQFWRPKL